MAFNIILKDSGSAFNISLTSQTIKEYFSTGTLNLDGIASTIFSTFYIFSPSGIISLNGVSTKTFEIERFVQG